MDYGYAPGLPTDNDRDLIYIERMRLLFQLRGVTNPPATDPPPETKLIRPRLLTLNQLIAHTKLPTARTTDGSPISLPMDNALLGAHANSEALLAFMMFPRQASGLTTYEILQETIDRFADSVDMDDLIVDDTGDPRAGFVHVKGCSIGKAVPFVEKLKQVLGNVKVTAPRHEHGLHETHQGVFEYLSNEWIVRRPSNVVVKNRRKVHEAPFKTKPEAVAAFSAEGFRFADEVANTPGPLVPSAAWQAWIPTNVTKLSRPSFPARLGAPLLGQRGTLFIHRDFIVKKQVVPFDLVFPEADIPDTEALRRQKFEDFVKTQPPFVAHPYSYPERQGYAVNPPDQDVSAQRFIDGYSWEFSKVNYVEQGVLKWALRGTGTRFIYMVTVPITHRETGNLVFNFHPHLGSALNAVTQLRENDPRYFLRV